MCFFFRSGDGTITGTLDAQANSEDVRSEYVRTLLDREDCHAVDEEGVRGTTCDGVVRDGHDEQRKINGLLR